MKKFYFLDGHSIIFRSFYAFIRNPLRNSKGMNTSAVFGFLNTVLRIIKKFEPDHLAIAFDTGKETFRDKEYKEYKATRPRSQMNFHPRFRSSLTWPASWGLPALNKRGLKRMIFWQPWRKNSKTRVKSSLLRRTRICFNW